MLGNFILFAPRFNNTWNKLSLNGGMSSSDKNGQNKPRLSRRLSTSSMMSRLLIVGLTLAILAISASQDEAKKPGGYIFKAFKHDFV